jgi:hypothetical protein
MDDQAKFAGRRPVSNERIDAIPAIRVITALQRELMFHALATVGPGSLHSLTVAALSREQNGLRSGKGARLRRASITRSAWRANVPKPIDAERHEAILVLEPAKFPFDSSAATEEVAPALRVTMNLAARRQSRP